MSLEKILIFGFGIAAVGALAVLGTTQVTDRKSEVNQSGYKADVEALVNHSK